MAGFSMNDDARSIGSSVKGVGCQDVNLPRGPVHFCEAPGFLTSTVHADGDDQPATAVAVLVYDPVPLPGRDRGRGLLAQMDAAAAREVAASLMRLADQLDPGGVN